MGSRKRQKPNPKEETNPKKETTPKSRPELSQTRGKGEENLRATGPATSADEVTNQDAGESAGNANTVGT